MDFVYNDGTSAHRGVWHATSDPKVVVHPAVTETKTYEVVDYRAGTPYSQRLEGVKYTKPYGDPGSCQRCSRPREGHPIALPRDRWDYSHAFEERRVYPVLGVTTLIISTPEFTEVTGKSRCGSGRFGGKNIERPDLYRIGTAKKYAGKTLKVIGGRVVDKYHRQGDTVPQPFCGNCLKAIEAKTGPLGVDEIIGGIEVID